MAKAGLRTFPLAVDNSDELKLIEAEFGIKGFAVVIKLLQCIYSKGYYTAWGHDEQLLFLDDYRLSSIGRGGVNEVVEAMLRRGVLDSSLYEKYKILTNRAIQETFLKANLRTTEVKLDKDYVLPEVYTFIQTASKKGNFANILWKNVDILPTKEKKGKERKVEDREGDAPAHEELKTYGEFQNIKLTADDYKNLAFRFSESDVKKAIDEMSRYKESTGTTYKSDYARLISWTLKNIADAQATKTTGYSTKPKAPPYQDKVYTDAEKAELSKILDEDIK